MGKKRQPHRKVNHDRFVRKVQTVLGRENRLLRSRGIMIKLTVEETNIFVDFTSVLAKPGPELNCIFRFFRRVN